MTPTSVRPVEQVAKAPGFGWNVRGRFHLLNVEGLLSSFTHSAKERQGFDKLSPNGVFGQEFVA